MTKEENRNIGFRTTEELLQWNAILFAEFVSNDPVFDDFWSMSKEYQEKIYQQFLNQNKNAVSSCDAIFEEASKVDI